MAELTVPALGESIIEATVGNWLKQLGEPVSVGEAVVELETDKVNLEIISDDAGVLQSVLAATGETVHVGDVLGVVSAAGAAAAAESVVAPTLEAEALAAPVATSTPAETVAAAPAPAVAQPARSEVVADLTSRAAPGVRRLALQQGVDLATVAGTGGVGRITADDVAAQANRQASAPAAVAPQSAPAVAAPTAPAPKVPQPTATASSVADAREERVRMSRRRLTIAHRLVQAQQTAAMLTTFNEVDMTAIMALRKRRRDPFKEAHGVGLGFMSFFTKAVVGALKAFPRLNAEIQGDDMIIKHYYDIGIAVSTETGLVVPPVRDADRLSFAGIEQAIANLAAKARANSLTLDDLRGGTFTITNGGVFGSMLSTPILNAPQVGILGMHSIMQRPVAVNGQVEIHPMMYLALSYDHRIVDGSEAVRFLVIVKKLLEDPELLLLEG